MTSFQIEVDSELETKELATKFASLLVAGDLIILEGELGAGKTYFVKFVAEFFNYNGLVSSPTFNIANFYEADKTLIHLDLYRLESVDQFFSLGLDEFFSDAITLAEWGNKISDYMDEYIHLKIEHIADKKNSRKFTFSSEGKEDQLIQLQNQLK